MKMHDFLTEETEIFKKKKGREKFKQSKILSFLCTKLSIIKLGLITLFVNLFKGSGILFITFNLNSLLLYQNSSLKFCFYNVCD